MFPLRGREAGREGAGRVFEVNQKDYELGTREAACLGDIFFHEDSTVSDSNVGRSSRVCDNDIKTFSHLISAQLHTFRSKKSGRV